MTGLQLKECNAHVDRVILYWQEVWELRRGVLLPSGPGPRGTVEGHCEAEGASA